MMKHAVTTVAEANQQPHSPQGSHAFWKVLAFLKIPGPGKSWKNILEVVHFQWFKFETSSSSV